MERTLPKLLSQALERNGLVQMLLDEAAYLPHGLGLRVTAGNFWPAAQASPISGSLGFLRPAEKSHVLAAWALGRARRPAVHTSARDGKEKVSIVARIPGQNSYPPFLLWHGGHFVLWHGDHCHFGLQIEYRIGSHSEESLGRAARESYPKLAVKPTFLQDAETQSTN
jgi:hypothetical protein